jgi:hypothetical protein
LSVTITGKNLNGATMVLFGSKAATTFTVSGSTQITAVVANGTSTGRISVTTPGGTAVSAANFTINSAPATPTVTGFNPTSGPVGTSVVITGTNLTGAAAVSFNGKAASSFTVNSATQITAVVATGSTTGKVSVTTSGGTATSASNFTVTTSSGGLDLSIDGLYITQATQEYPNPAVPLVQNRSAWIRVFVLANQANSVAPQVKVDFVKGATTNTLTINAPGASVPLTIDPTNASLSWNAAVSSAWIQPGTTVTATVDPTNLIAESNESNNQSSLALDVRSLKTWKVTVVPVHTTDGNTGVVENGTRTRADWVDFARRVHPVADAIDVAVGSVVNSSVKTLLNDGTGWDTVLGEVDAKRTADGATDRYYFGAVHVTYSSGVAGLGYIGYPVAMGWDVNGSFPTVLAHEEGHNFGRQHSPCGGASGPDPNYPYPGAVIGVTGWDAFASSNNIKGANTYVDVMSYCSPVWVSDYVYENVLAFRASSNIGGTQPGTGAGEGLLVWGRIENGQVTLEPAFRVPANASLPEPGPYTWEAHDAFGRVIASASFTPHEVADIPDHAPQLFSFIVPLDAAVLPSVQSMHVKFGNQELAGVHQSAAAMTAPQQASTLRIDDLPDHATRVTWDAEQYPVVMLRDGATGEVRGFLRGGSAEATGLPAEFEILMSDGIQTRVERHARIE